MGSTLTRLVTGACRRGSLAALLCCASLANIAEAREAAPASNPFNGDPAAIHQGAASFRINCGICHGMNARGGLRGPSLTSNRWSHGGTDHAIFRTITQGVSGTEMPANDLEPDEVWKIIAYLRSLAPAPVTLRGEVAKGRTLFESKGCPTCHMVNGQGGALGPELSRVGASRSVSYLIESIREPDRQLSTGNSDPNDHYGMPAALDTVTVVTRSGDRVTGIAKNEDPFSVQLLDQAQRLRFFEKPDIAAVIHEPRSLMPAYGADALSEPDLQDLIAYLGSLK